MKRVIITAAFIAITSSLLLAAGPANISDGLRMWLDANAMALNNNDPVSSWTDLSGNNKHAVQDTASYRPLFKTNVLNGKPAVVFDGSNDYLTIDGSMVANTNYSIFAVVKRNSSNPGSFNYYMGGTQAAMNRNLQLGWRSNTTLTHGQYTNDYDMRVPSYSVSMPAYLITTRHSNSLGNDTYLNGALKGLNMNNVSSARLVHLSSWQGASIGRYIDNTINTRFNGYVAELIIYNRYLSETERKSVESYLATKYGLTNANTASPEHYTGMNELTVTSSKLTETKSSSGLSIKGDYISATSRIRMGNDNAVGTSNTFNPDQSSYPNFVRLNREWFLEYTLGSINCTFNFDTATLLPGSSLPSGNQYRLLYRADNGANYSIISSNPSIAGSVVSFTVNAMVAVTNSGLYTLGTLDDDVSVLPVELSSFTGVFNSATGVKLEWVTQSETAVAGFYILRNASEDVNTAVQISPFISATNNSATSHYQFTDASLNDEGSYYYWLQCYNLDGTNQIFGPVQVSHQQGSGEVTPEINPAVGFTNIYPNPFNPSVTIAYYKTEGSEALVSVYNLRGQQVKQWSIPAQQKGAGSVVWDAEGLSSGVYLFTFKCGDANQTRKVSLTK